MLVGDRKNYLAKFYQVIDPLYCTFMIIVGVTKSRKFLFQTLWSFGVTKLSKCSGCRFLYLQWHKVVKFRPVQISYLNILLLITEWPKLYRNWLFISLKHLLYTSLDICRIPETLYTSLDIRRIATSYMTYWIAFFNCIRSTDWAIDQLIDQGPSTVT